MNERDALKNFVWNPLAWAADCRAQARFKTEPEAQAAFLQLAEEFEATANEIVGLIATVEALSRHKLSAPDPHCRSASVTNPAEASVG
jgi:hypothetical protein